MRIFLNPIVGYALLLPSVTACTGGPDPAEPSLVRLQAVFGLPSEAGMAEGLQDWRRTRLGPGGLPIPAVWTSVRQITVDPQTLAARFAPAGQGRLAVAIGYWTERGLRQTGESGPVQVTYTLWTGDGTLESPGLGTQITAGTATLIRPNATFTVDYPLPESPTPSSIGVLTGFVGLPDGRQLPFREIVTRRSPWLP